MACHAQTIGGSSAYPFLKLPQTPSLSAVGGVNVSYVNGDVDMTTGNPAAFTEKLHGQVSASFNHFYTGIKAYHLTGAYHSASLNTTFGTSLFFIDYGNISRTDAAGNEGGTFRPRDYVFQVYASRAYLQKWKYGFSLKLIQSAYDPFSSSAIAVDAGLLFMDSSRNISAGLSAKNIGVQIKPYHTEREDMPFDLQIGITKKLAKAPLGFSLNAQQIHQFNLYYNDTAFNNENNLSSKGSGLTKLFNHFIFASHLYLSKHLETSIGYNRLRRAELNTGNGGNGLNGFSLGFHAHFTKLRFHYARAYFQRSTAYNQFAITLDLPALTGNGVL